MAAGISCSLRNVSLSEFCFFYKYILFAFSFYCSKTEAVLLRHVQIHPCSWNDASLVIQFCWLQVTVRAEVLLASFLCYSKVIQEFSLIFSFYLSFHLKEYFTLKMKYLKMFLQCLHIVQRVKAQRKCLMIEVKADAFH